MFEFLWRRTPCSNCGNQDARGFLLWVRCPNPRCVLFDGRQGATGTNPLTGESLSRAPAPPMVGEVKPGMLEIRYRNFRGEERVYHGDPATVRRKRNHITVCLAPRGARAAFSRDRIRNLAEVEQYLKR